MRTTVLIAALLLAACASGPPHGGHGRGPGGRLGLRDASDYARFTTPQRRTVSAAPDALLFAGFDKNTDLIISPDEITEGIRREFARADQNHDGLINLTEFNTWRDLAMGGPYGPSRTDFDTDDNEHISAQEFADEIRLRAQQYDANGDGVIDHGELLHQSAAPQQPDGDERDNGPPPP